jgi:hypothetical protein
MSIIYLYRLTARQTNRENKKMILVNAIREFHKAVKKLQKFIKNCGKFPKVDRLDVISA